MKVHRQFPTVSFPFRWMRQGGGSRSLLPGGHLLILIPLAVILANPPRGPAADAAPPGDEQQSRPESSLITTASAESASPSVDVKVIDTVINGSTDAAAIPRLHPELVVCCRDLERSIHTLRELDGYTAQWIRQERVDGSLRDQEKVHIKIRHQPFSVYMEWADGSQKVWFVEGRNDNRLVARKSRGLASLRRYWLLAPESPLAMKDSRYPITELGMLKLAERLHSILARQPHDRQIEAHVSTVEHQGRLCRRHVIEFAKPDDHERCARSEFHIDEETSALVSITNHSLCSDGESLELLEHYRYDDIQFNPGLTEEDFAAQKGG